MATIIAPSVRDTVYQGPLGNASLAEASVTMKGAAAGDIVQLFDLPGGLRIYGIQIISSALGANVKGTFQIADRALVADKNLAAAGNTVSSVQPFTVPDNGGILEMVISGGDATGTLTVILQYTSTGNI